MIEITEEAILCCMLLEKSACTAALAKLKSQDFYQYKHQLLFESMQQIRKDNKEADIVTLTDKLREQNNLDKVGGVTYITHLTDTVPTAGHINSYIKTLKEQSEKRRLKQALQSSLQNLDDPTLSHEEILNQAQKNIYNLFENRVDKPYITNHQLMLKYFDVIESRKQTGGGISWGYEKLDKYLGKILPKRVYLIGARPGMGKTGLGLGIGLRIANQGSPVYVATMEMSDEQIADRQISLLARISGQELEQGRVDNWTSLTDAAAKLAKLPIAIDDTRQTTTELMLKVRQYQSEMGGKLGAVVVDYLQLFTDSANGMSTDERISMISGALVQMSKELNTAVICLSQLNRENEKSADKIPQLSHLRGGGSQEQDAWAVLLLHREEYYKPDTSKQGLAEVIIAKNRSGPTGIVKLKFEGKYALFADY